MLRMTFSVITVLLGACATTPQTSSSTMVPFDMTSGRPVVQVTLKDGSTAPFIFDTGAMGGSISQALVARLGLPIIGKARIGSPHGGAFIEADVVDMGRISLGTVEAKLNTATSAAQLDSFAPGGAGNILSPRQFSDKVVEFDFSVNQISIGTRPRTAPATWFRFDERGFLSGTAQVNRRDVPFTIDVGNPGGLIVSLALARSLKSDASLTDTGVRMGPINAQRPLFLGSLDVPLQLGDIKTQVGTIGALDGAPDYLNIGAQALTGMTLVLDYPNNRWGIVGTAANPINMTLHQRQRAASAPK